MTGAVPAAGLDGFNRRLQRGLGFSFVLLAALLIGVGLWFEQPWSSSGIPSNLPPASNEAISLEVSR